MNHSIPSTAGRRQFNDTAISKLVAEGIPRAVASAFVNIGIDKSGRYAQLRDHVCKMEYVQHLLPRTMQDYKDPVRVGSMSPYVEELKVPRFFTEFAMSDVEAARFTACFPEFNVVPRGTTYNQHGYYANKRYAETELLMSEVFAHARRHGDRFDPRSVTDVGGNEVWHEKRGRSYVHCDNPVLSARDVARYVTREVFSGSNRSDASVVCNKTFSLCTHKSDYGIGVHSTYDISPRAIAYGMLKRNMKMFFLVINVVPGVHRFSPGQYEVDGMVVTVDKPSGGPVKLRYTFKHDPSLEYGHSATTHDLYMNTRKRFDFVEPSGRCISFVYRINSVRGNSLVASVERVVDPEYLLTDSVWMPARKKSYYLTVAMLDVSDLEVDTEFFDRLVLQAVGNRSAENYDVVSLFKYAKSLRQRVSINGIVLSSGYTINPDQLVVVVLAAFATAAASRVESAEFFREASSQLHSRRSQGVVRDVLRVAAGFMVAPLAALGVFMTDVSGYAAADRFLKSQVRDNGSVLIRVDKPHSGAGMTFVPDMLKKPPTVKGGLVLVSSGSSSSWHTPLAPGGWNPALVPTHVHNAGKELVYLSYSVPSLGFTELPGGVVLVDGSRRPAPYSVVLDDIESSVKSEEFRAVAYSRVLERVVGAKGFDTKPLVLPTGDRLFRKSAYSLVDEPELPEGRAVMLKDSDAYVVFRGVGTKAVALKPPKCYSRGRCLRFVLFYEDEVSDMLGSLRAGKQVGAPSPDVVKAVALLGRAEGARFVDRIVKRPAELAVEDAGDTSASEWDRLSSTVQPSVDVVRDVPTVGKGSRFVHTSLDKGRYYMSGALPDVQAPDSPPPSIASTDTLVRSAVAAQAVLEPPRPLPAVSESVGVFDSETRLFDLDSGAPTATATQASVSSSGVVWGKEAMLEQVRLCDAARGVALSSSAEVVDMAVAVSRSEAPMSSWGAMVQGKQGGVVPVRVTGDVYTDIRDGSVVKHMAVSDGVDVYDRITNPPPDGMYVTSDVMQVYTGAAVRDAVELVLDQAYSCEVTNVDGVAGCGKTHTIVENAREHDVVLCETTAALADTARRLAAKPYWRGRAYTVDAFLMHRPVGSCDVLWVDESLRLHAAKVFAALKLLKPTVVYCFGDKKQIPMLSFVPGFELVHGEFPFTSVKVQRDTWRCPADVCMVTSQGTSDRARYYGFHVVTHNPVMRSLKGPVVFESGMFQALPDDVVLIVYTQQVKEDLAHAGVKRVMTIGESQGSTFDKVVLFRDNLNPKPLYFDLFQSLVAITRHKVSLTYVTVSPADNSAVAMDLYYLRDKQSELLLASHLFASVRPAGRRAADVGSVSRVSSGSGPLGTGDGGDYDSDVESIRYLDWAEDLGEDFQACSESAREESTQDCFG